MIPREVRILFRKEWRQLLANRTAIATSFIPQVLFLLVVPHVLLSAASAARTPSRPPPIDLGMIGDVGADPTRAPLFLMPLFVAIAGITVPMMLAIHALVSERETRTLDLLVILPVRLSHVLQAKALAVLAMASGVSSVLLTLIAAELLVLGLAGPLEVLALYLELFAAIAAGTMGALTIGFHAPDFRTAQNVSAAYILPMIFAGVLLSALTGGGLGRPLAIAGFYALWAASLTAHAARQRSFEQLFR